MWKLSIKEKQEICSLYKNGMTSPQIANKFNVSFVAILGILKRRDVEIRSNSDAQNQRKCSLDETVFDRLNEKSLYWLGFIFADGCIVKRHGKSPELSFSLKNEDIAHLQKFKSFLKSSSSLIYIKQHNSNRFAVRSVKLVKKLEKYGITERKSLTASVSNENLYNSKHFWRGVIDGDGHIGMTTNNNNGKIYPRIELVGSKDMVSKFNNFVFKNIIQHRSQTRKHKSIYIVSFHGKTAIPVVEYLYSNSHIYLDRKNVLAKALGLQSLGIQPVEAPGFSRGE